MTGTLLALGGLGLFLLGMATMTDGLKSLVLFSAPLIGVKLNGVFDVPLYYMGLVKG